MNDYMYLIFGYLVVGITMSQYSAFIIDARTGHYPFLRTLSFFFALWLVIFAWPIIVITGLVLGVVKILNEDK